MEYLTEVGFPTQGVRELAPFAAQEPGTSPDMLNVVPFDTKGRLRGGVRPGLDLWSSSQVNSTNAVQCIQNLSASDVSPHTNPGDFRMSSWGNTSGFSGAGLFNTTGTEVQVSTTHGILATCIGSDGRLYCLTYSAAVLYLECFNSSAVSQYVVAVANASTTPAGGLPAEVFGFVEDSGIIYLWYNQRNNLDFLTGVSRYRASDGAKLDLTRDGLLAGFDSALSNTQVKNGMDVRNGIIATFGPGDGKFSLIDTKLGVTTTYDWETYVAGVTIYKYSICLTEDGGVVLAVFLGSQGYQWCHNVSDGSLRWGKEGSNVTVCCPVLGTSGRPRMAFGGSSVFGSGMGVVIVDSMTGAPIMEGQGGQAVNWIQPAGNGGFWIQVGAQLRYLSPTDLSTSQTYTLTSTSYNFIRSRSSNFINSGRTEAGSARYNEVISISNGTAYKMTTSASTAISGGTGFESDADPIFSIQYGAQVFFADGASKKYYSARDNAIADWDDDCSYGDLPSGFRYIERWKDRVFLFGFSDDPSNWYTSAANDPFDWEIGTSRDYASSGRKSAAGVFPGKLQAVIPYDENLCILGGDGQIRQLKGDPASSGDMDFVSDTVGIAAGRAWCKDGYGNVYFFGANGGLYRLTLNAPAERVSVNAIDERLLGVNTDAHIVTLHWDEVKQGVWVFLRPTDGTNADSYFYSVRTNGFFPVRFASANYIPLTTTLLDHDSSMDQKILYACKDGYIRTPVDGRTQDATNASSDDDYEAFYTLGPWTARQGVGMEAAIDRVDVMMADNSQANISILKGATAEGSVSGDVIWKETCSSEETTVYNPEVGGRALTMKIEPTDGQDMSIDRIRIAMRDQQHNA